MYALINGIIMRTRAINESTASTSSLFDEDAVYLIESVVGGLHICKRYDPLLFVRAFNRLHAKTETMTVLLRAFRCRSFSSVCRAVGHPG